MSAVKVGFADGNVEAFEPGGISGQPTPFRRNAPQKHGNCSPFKSLLQGLPTYWCASRTKDPEIFKRLGHRSRFGRLVQGHDVIGRIAMKGVALSHLRIVPRNDVLG